MELTRPLYNTSQKLRYEKVNDRAICRAILLRLS